MDQIDLTDFFKTKAEASDFNARLSHISESVYQTDFDLSKMLSEQFGILKKDKFMTLLRDNKIMTTSPSALKEFFGKIQEKITSMPVLSLTLAFVPGDKNLKTFSEWFLMNIKRQVLLEINVDTSLLGGAAFTFEGKYLDCSIKPKFIEVLNKLLADKKPEPSPPLATHQSVEHMHIGR